MKLHFIIQTGAAQVLAWCYFLNFIYRNLKKQNKTKNPNISQ